MEMDELKLKKRLERAKQEKNSTLEARILTDLAEIYMEKGEYSLAIENFMCVAKYYRSDKGKLLEYATANRRIGECYLNSNKFKKALYHLNSYLKIVEDLQIKVEEQRATATLGYLYLTKYEETSQQNDCEDLKKASSFFHRSLEITKGPAMGVSKLEITDMSARLYTNLGLVQEHFGNSEKAANLYEKAIELCEGAGIYEQLQRCYMAYAHLLEKKGDSKGAIERYNLAIEAAMKFKKNPLLLAGSLSAKADLLIKLGDFKGARTTLYKAYKLKIDNEKQRNSIEHNLRTIVAMCRYEDKLLATDGTDYRQLKEFYEKIGDGACELKHYSKALDYYHKMLDAANHAGAPAKELSTCYYSLAETYKDNKQYTEAVKYYENELALCTSWKDSLNTLSMIADTKESANLPHTVVEEVYERAIEVCQRENNPHEEGCMLKRFIEYLKRQNQHIKANELERKLYELSYSSSESDDEENDAEESGLHIGADLDLDNLTDYSDDLEEATTSAQKRSRTKHFPFKRNAKGETPLHLACIRNDLASVKMLLAQKHPVNLRDNCGWLPLHEVCNYGYFDIVKLLLEHGAAINDRGGTESGGITPLHDAASNGHLNVVKLLLDKGANAVAKTDEGHTVLYYLKTWRSEHHLDEETSILYESIVERVSSLLRKAGQSDNTNQKMKQIETGSRSPRKDLRRARNVSSEEVSEEENIARDYRNTINNIRTRISPKQSNSVETRSIPALVEVNEITEDWLEDDLQQGAPKRRRTNSFRKSPMQLSRRPVEPEVEQYSDTSEEVAVVEDIEDSRIISVSSTSQKPKTNVKRKRKRQAKLTSFGHTRTFVGTEADSTSSPNLQRMSASPVLSRSNSVGSARQSISPSRSWEVSANPVPTMSPTLGVDVKINGRLYRVPVLMSQVHVHTIKWLAEEAAHRYSQREYVKPTLELETVDGAYLADEDPISMLFTHGETQTTVIARTLKWTSSPLMQRYKKACAEMAVEPAQSICEALEELTISVDVSDKGLKGSLLAPLCKALNQQSILRELDFSGNFLTTECLQLLGASLATLEHLNKLSLRRTGLSSETFAVFIEALKAAGEDPVKIEELDLGDNCLTNDSLRSLSRFSNLHRLKVLNMSMNNFRPFAQWENFPLALCSVEVLNLSDNELDTTSLLKILAFTSKSVVKKLVLSRNKPDAGFLATLLEMWNAQRTETLNLESLEISRFHVNDAELFDLLAVAGCLKSLDISYNPDLTTFSLRRLLQSKSLSSLNLLACQDIFKYIEEFTKFVTLSKDDHKCKHLKLDNNPSCDYLIELWHQWYGCDVQIRRTDYFLDLSVNVI